ncbi:MAG: YncE family protein, partial [Bacteroidales bacterium]
MEADVLMGRQGSDPVYLSPLSLVSHPSGGKIYVGLSTAASVAVVDVETSRLERTISLPFQPKAVAVSADGSQLFLADGQPQGHVYALSTVNDSLLWKLAVEHTPTALAFDAVNQLLYVANRFSNSISVVDPQKRSCIARLPVIREPKSVKVS